MNFIYPAVIAAVQEGEKAWGTTHPNPPVGAVVLSSNGSIVGRGHTQPPGGSHAEIMALRQAGENTKGGTLVVTLEPCNHWGRTGPCSHAISESGIEHVVYLMQDTGSLEKGGAEYLRRQGLKVTFLDLSVAAEDHSSKWITGSASRDYANRQRRHFDAIIVGTGTVKADNPALTARKDDGTLLPHQPLKVVIGTSKISEGTQLARSGFVQFSTIEEALVQLWDRGVRYVLVEGGPHLLHGFLTSGNLDQLHSYSAPMLLTRGVSLLQEEEKKSAESANTTIASSLRGSPQSISMLGDDILQVINI
ncbi:bifunctional diaminohydroxyphosphoribosylaminopyrimidine deaminase/5-amino-6-(5-phosphoribosylamino)uracil reductase RibD [Corynebacterium diphtheriae]|uniref:bifunctional diaminohydroxyphosphoribosylaminopyrimidine deaminase/5-amino-6-(5-phosphoribosylamino)uracil reductase RibD n=1 Tax=Corynebacterium diphtheriae TaxID=1717 RepID=UPI001E41A5EE|nr:bifunctional diaminohydroxyphosphoribosylaminopyrimidine deaminase/5-amino-6-(5-phosphoribosylamino)uracil reductase RibD [Corynebacterium diphtheriae]UFX15289.1 bifunctional diaminohydroxyphosphoribosylaminopyrimidine deaminase/5-amino-6-(5-phosphoribosylamino)uracil reductase RibD [Corynebacterium diphtheriae]